MIFTVLTFVGVLHIITQEQPLRGAGPGLVARIATSSNPTVSTSVAAPIFATSTSPMCSSRIVSTTGSAVMLYFSDILGQRPSFNSGHVQAASSTVMYDAELYGCSAVYAYGFTSTVITVSEAR